MKCPKCSAPNREGRRFCAKCGAALAVACARCGAINASDDDFCGGCGKALGNAAPSHSRALEFPELERRQLTVMFCDLVGSTALSHRLDPEDLVEVIRAYRKRAGDVIARFEGFVARYLGDGILVYFGYPHAHEDDAARAIHTGLAIVEAFDRLGPEPESEQSPRLGVRIGIATGRVVVGDLIGEGASEASAAMGETPNLAARLQALAPPNAVLVASATRELAGGQFEYADDGTHALKGFDEPVRVWRVLRTREVESRFEAAKSHRLTPLVGRDGEIDLLLGLWHRARTGDGQVMLLSGEAGIGKSRIAETLGERIAGEPHVRLHYQCSPYHANSPLYPFIQELERAADFTRADTATQKLDKLEALLATTAPLGDDRLSLFAALLSLPSSGRYPPLAMTPEQQKDKTLAALSARLDGLAARAPLLIVFEDAHWIDPTSIEFLNLFAPHAREIPVLAIITSRTTVDYPWLGLQHVISMQLERLDRHHAATMIGRLLEGKALPGELIEQIMIKTDGVPLFIEELIKALEVSDTKDRDATSTRVFPSEVPSTLQDSLMARLDQLGAAKEVAQMGAVIGREFTRELVAAISSLDEGELHDALTKLTSSMVVFGQGQPPGTTFMFKHALVQEAAYSSLLRGKRQESHWHIAQTLERSYPERARVEPEVVAHHYTQAGRSLQAATYWTAAAQRALDRSANLEALGQATKGLDLLAGVARGVERDGLELGLEILRGAAFRAIKGFASSDAERSFSRARDLCERLEDLPRLIDARRGLFSCYYARGALALAGEQGREVATLGQRTNDFGSRMLGHWMLGCVSFWQGAFATARSELEEAFSLYDPNEQRAKTLALQIDPGVNSLSHLSWLRWILGYPDQAVQTSEKAISMARQLSQPLALAMALFFACTTRACCGQRDSARLLLDELSALTAEHGLGYFGSCARVLEAQALIAAGHCVGGLEQISRAFNEFRAQEAGVGLPWVMSISAAAYARLGKFDEGLATLSAAFAAAGRNGEHHWEAELWRSKGEYFLLLPTPNRTDAQACFRRAIELARQQTARSLELRATTSLARLLDGEGNNRLAQRMLADACDLFSEGADTADIREARMALRTLRLSPS